MLDIGRLREQFDGFSAHQAREQSLSSDKRKRALATLRDPEIDWDRVVRERVPRLPWLIADPRETPSTTSICGPRPTPMTVVASDGSQIYPDRNVEPTCYLLNISRVVFRYGTLERPLMESVPMFRYRQADLEEYFDTSELERFGEALFERATADVVSALRDQLELESLLDAACRAVTPGRPIAAIADGTLIRWMLSALGNKDLTQSLTARYVKTLSGFREAEIPVCSYISMPRNTEVVNLLRAGLDEREDMPPEAETLHGLRDRDVFEALLKPGERSAIFQTSSHNQQEYGIEEKVCYFYVRLTGPGYDEIGRVELPAWVAADPRRVDVMHALILSECEKGEGYPLILSEAHEQAVIRAREKELFYTLIETEMQTAGLRFDGSRKQASKRRPIV